MKSTSCQTIHAYPYEQKYNDETFTQIMWTQRLIGIVLLGKSPEHLLCYCIPSGVIKADSTVLLTCRSWLTYYLLSLRTTFWQVHLACKQRNLSYNCLKNIWLTYSTVTSLAALPGSCSRVLHVRRWHHCGCLTFAPHLLNHSGIKDVPLM